MALPRDYLSWQRDSSWRQEHKQHQDTLLVAPSIEARRRSNPGRTRNGHSPIRRPIRSRASEPHPTRDRQRATHVTICGVQQRAMHVTRDVRSFMATHRVAPALRVLPSSSTSNTIKQYNRNPRHAVESRRVRLSYNARHPRANRTQHTDKRGRATRRYQDLTNRGKAAQHTPSPRAV